MSAVAVGQSPVAGTSQSPAPAPAQSAGTAVESSTTVNDAAATATAPAANGAQDTEMADGTTTTTEQTEEELPADANEVLYVNNLNERIKLKGESTNSCTTQLGHSFISYTTHTHTQS